MDEKIKFQNELIVTIVGVFATLLIIVAGVLGMQFLIGGSLIDLFGLLVR